jgi:FkbM family methyltransferase
MLARIKGAVRRISLARRAYAEVRSWPERGVGRRWRDRLQGRKLFENYGSYAQALYQKGEGTAVLRTHDGLSITIRQNLWDARVVREIFFARPYVRHVALAPNPTIVDIGGYIGDFTLYAAKYLDASRVIVYEPTAENFAILTRNIEANGYGNRVIAVNKAVSDSDEVTLNVRTLDSGEVHVSAYWYQDSPQRKVQAVTLPDLLRAHRLEFVDLVKIDCEGGEYDILSAVPQHVFARIRNIVFEYHPVEGFEAKLRRVLDGLQRAGFTLREDGHIVSAYRA